MIGTKHKVVNTTIRKSAMITRKRKDDDPLSARFSRKMILIQTKVIVIKSNNEVFKA